jgi:xanthine/uracil permease
MYICATSIDFPSVSIGGIVGKLGAVLTLIPDPIIGGTLTVVFGMVAAEKIFQNTINNLFVNNTFHF